MARPLYREEITRMSLMQLRAQFTPRLYRQMEAVRLEAHGHVAVVELVREPASHLRGGATARRYFRCPTCGHRANVIGVDRGRGWSCSTCGRWRGGRRRRRINLIDTMSAEAADEETL